MSDIHFLSFLVGDIALHSGVGLVIEEAGLLEGDHAALASVQVGDIDVTVVLNPHSTKNDVVHSRSKNEHEEKSMGRTLGSSRSRSHQTS